MIAAPALESLTPREQRTVRAAVRILERTVRAGQLLGSPGLVRTYLSLAYAGEPRERFRVLFLDAQNRLIAAEEVAIGTLTLTAVHPREVARRALAVNAAAVILVHNHPSGCAEPSRSDELLTEQLRAALQLIDVQVLDHFIVAGADCASLAEVLERRQARARELESLAKRARRAAARKGR